MIEGQNIERKTFNIGMNVDDGDFIIPNGEYRKLINGRILTSKDGKDGYVTNIKGNAPVKDETSLGSGINRVIGFAEDAKKQRGYYLVYNSNGHHFIKQYDKKNDTTTILLDNDLFLKDGVNLGLNFERDKFITGIDVVGDMLFWTDPIPRRINIERLLSGQYKEGFQDDLISIIRRPPNIPLEVRKDKTLSVGDTDKIRNNSFQFAWRFVYYDGETSVLSPYSRIINYSSDKTNFDTVNVSLPENYVINQDVRLIQIAVRNDNTGNFFIVKTWDKEKDADRQAIQEYNEGDELNFYFYNDVLGEAIPEADAAKPFESVPLYSEGLAASNNRIFLADNTSGYDTPKNTSLQLSKGPKVKIDYGDTNKIYGEWHYYLRWWHAGIGKVRHDAAWFIRIEGYDGIDDGYYGIDGVDGSERGNTIYGDSHNIHNQDFSFPAEAEFVDLQKIGDLNMNKKSALISFYSQPNKHHFKFGTVNHSPITILGGTIENGFKAQRVFKTNGIHSAGIVFYDKYMRSSSVVHNEQNKIHFDDTDFNNESFVNTVNWQLSNSDYKEIPDWAEYYGIALTKNLQTKFFLQAYPYEIAYVSKDDDGNYKLEKDDYSSSFEGIAVDLSALANNGIGYALNKGDIATFYFKGIRIGLHSPVEPYKTSLSVMDQWGKYLILELDNVGGLVNTTDFLMELYTPYRANVNELFYEIGQIFPINNPGTSDRQYSETSGSVQGDVWVKVREKSTSSGKGIQAMNPNDKFFDRWVGDYGRPNILPQPDIGQSLKEGEIAVSNPYIPKTFINGLCSFDTTNFKNLPVGAGPIRKLITASKTQNSEGSIMLAICENETYSLYIGETRVMQQTGDAFISATNSVIGTINPLKGDYGTINPESVARKDGHVFWIDLKKGKVIRYASNGLYPISDLKMSGFFYNRCKELLWLSESDIANLGIDGVFCPGGYDDFNKEYLVFLPKTESIPELLEDIIRETYQFNLKFVSSGTKSTGNTALNKSKFYDAVLKLEQAPVKVSLKYNGKSIFNKKTVNDTEVHIPVFAPDISGGEIEVFVDGKQDVKLLINELQPNLHRFDLKEDKLLAFKEKGNRWDEQYPYAPEYFGSIGDTLYSFKEGRMYKHGEGDYNTFYGEKHPLQICFVANENAINTKLFGGMNLLADVAPDYVHIRTEKVFDGKAYHQSSDLVKEDFKNEESVFYAPFYLDRLSPNVEGSHEEKMLNGDAVSGQTLLVFIEFDAYDKLIALQEAGIFYQLSTGHHV